MNNILVNGEAGRLAIKWQALRDLLKESAASPHHNPIIREAIHGCDNPTALAIIQEYDRCVELWSREARVMASDRIYYDLPSSYRKPCPKCGKRFCANSPKMSPADLKFKIACDRFQFLGWMAYTNDIDRSPTHCPKTRRALRSHPNSEVVALIRHWEDGWDTGYQCAIDLKLERKSKVGKSSQIISSTICGSTKELRRRDEHNENNNDNGNGNG